MTQILVYTNDNSVFSYGTIEKSDFFNNGEELYRVTTPDGSVEYAVTNGYESYDVDSVPEGFEPNKYCYTEEKGFYINPNYTEPNDNAETLNELRNLITEFHDDAKITDSDYDNAIALIDKINV